MVVLSDDDQCKFYFTIIIRVFAIWKNITQQKINNYGSVSYIFFDYLLYNICRVIRHGIVAQNLLLYFDYNKICYYNSYMLFCYQEIANLSVKELSLTNWLFKYQQILYSCLHNSVYCLQRMIVKNIS